MLTYMNTMNFSYQHTLAREVSCVGIGLHSGENVRMTLRPAKEDSGICFIRKDVRGFNPQILANYKNVSDTNLGTTISNDDGTIVSTIEHLMAAFWGCAVDNAIVELDGPEVPIMDGSAEPFVFLIECAGVQKQSNLRRIIEVLKPIEVKNADGHVILSPADSFSVNMEINFDNPVVAQQHCHFNSSNVSFKTDLCRARTFGFESEINTLRASGLARGGSLDNAIVVGKKKILNKNGLRYVDEFVRHKVLDCIGDFNLIGGYLRGSLKGYCSGHSLNNLMLHKLFDTKDAWHIIANQPEPLACSA